MNCMFRGYGYDKIDLHPLAEGELDEAHRLQNIQQYPDRGQSHRGNEIQLPAGPCGRIGRRKIRKEIIF